MNKKKLHLTNVCRFRKLEARDLASYIIDHRSEATYLQNRKLAILTVSDNSSTLPRFALPFFIDHRDKIIVGDTDFVIVDVRGLKASDVEMMKNLALHTLVWESSYTNEEFTGFTQLPLIAYTRWQTVMMSNRFNLSADEQNEVGIYFALFYMLQTRTTKELFNSSNYSGTVQQLQNATGISVAKITSVLESIDEKDFPEDKAPELSQLIDKLATTSPRLKSILTDWTILLGITGNSFMGPRGSSLCNLATEYPPAMITLLITLLIDNSFHRSTVANLLKDQVLSGKYRQLGKDFTRTYKLNIDGYYE